LFIARACVNAQASLLPGGLLAMSATFCFVPLADSVTQLAGIFAVAAVCSQGVRSRRQES
jgi:hypothetical protein